MIDREKFQDYFQYYDRETVIEIIDLFLGDCSSRMEKIRKSIDTADFNDLQFNAHSLKGVVASFMDKDAANCALRLEEMAKSRTNEGLNQTYSDLINEIEVTLIELKEIRNTL